MLRKYQQWPAIALLVLAIVFMVTPSVPPFIVFILLIASAVLFFISSRGSYYFSKAYKIFKAGNFARYEEGLGYIRKAVKAGMPDNYLVIATDGPYTFSGSIPFDEDFLGTPLRDGAA